MANAASAVESHVAQPGVPSTPVLRAGVEVPSAVRVLRIGKISLHALDSVPRARLALLALLDMFVTKIGWKGHGHVTHELFPFPYSDVMRGAFVVQISSAIQLEQGQFEGWIEEVDSGRQFKFRSAQELLAFIHERMQTVAKPTDAQKQPEI